MLKFPKTSECLPPRCYISFIIQLRFLQQYFPIPVPCNNTWYCMAMRCPSNKEVVYLNGELLGILCEKRKFESYVPWQIVSRQNPKIVHAFLHHVMDCWPRLSQLPSCLAHPCCIAAVSAVPCTHHELKFLTAFFLSMFSFDYLFVCLFVIIPERKSSLSSYLLSLYTFPL